MKPMYGIHEVLRHSLLEISNRCQSLRQDIAEFVNIVSTLPAAMVKLRLTAMTYQITMLASHLRKQHGGKGVVVVMMSHMALSVHWAEKEFPPESKDDFRKRGYLILSPEEIADLTNKLAEKVNSGQFAQAVDWINRYEPSVTNNQVGIG